MRKAGERLSSGGPAICARPSGKAPSPARWNTASSSVGGICLRTTLSKDSVWVGHLCALAVGSSALARGKRGDQPEHDQSSCPCNFLSHELETRIQKERYRKGRIRTCGRHGLNGTTSPISRLAKEPSSRKFFDAIGTDCVRQTLDGETSRYVEPNQRRNEKRESPIGSPCLQRMGYCL